MQGWVGGAPSLTRVNPIYSEAEDAGAGRSKASSSGYGSQRGSGGGSLASRPPPSRHLDPRLVPHPVWPLEDPYNLYSTYSRRPSSTRGNILLRSQVYRAPSESSLRSGTGKGDRFIHQLLASKEGTYAAASDGYSSRSDTGRHLDSFIARHQSYLKQQVSEKGETKRDFPTRRISVTDASEINYITKEFDYMMRLNELSDARARRRKEREKYNSYKSRKSSRDELRYVSKRSRRAKENSYVIEPRERKSASNSAKSDSDNSSLKTIKPVKAKIIPEKTIEENVSKSNNVEIIVKIDKPAEPPKKESDVYFDSLQADPFLLYSHFIADEEARTQTSSVRGETRTNIKNVPVNEKTDAGYSYVSEARSGSDNKEKTIINEVKSENSVKEPDKIITEAEYTTIAEVERDADGKLVQHVRESEIKYNEIREEIQNGSLTVEREDYLRALLQDVAAALEEALDGRRAPQALQSGVLKEARERVAMGLVALRRAGPEELRELSAALSRGPACPVVRTMPPSAARAPSPHARKPSLWQQYYMRAHSIHSLDSATSCIDQHLRPEAQFTLGVAGERRLAARLEDSRRNRRACRFSAAALALLFFVLTVVACSLLLSNGRAPFGSMM